MGRNCMGVCPPSAVVVCFLYRVRMGLVQSLDYEVPRPSPLQRAIWHVSSSRPGAWVFARSLPSVDRLVLSLSRGKLTLTEILSGVPIITLVTVGAHSRRRRATPLLGVPVGDDIAVIGTRFAQRGTPAWYHNLRAARAAEVSYRGETVGATAREAGEGEREQIWSRARELYSGYDVYAERIHDRPIHVMVLSLAEAAASRTAGREPQGEGRRTSPDP